MNKKSIGIVGATGQVGVGVVETLLKNSQYQLLLGSRKVDKLIEKYGQESEAIVYKVVDVFDEENIVSFCNRCDLVINAVGPSSIVLDRVANACMQTNTNYIDVSGDKTMKKAIEEAFIKHESATTLALSAGVYPGLTEMFVAFLLQQSKETVDHISCYFAGKGTFSETGAYDIVSSLEKDEGYGMSYYSNDEIKKLTSEIGSQKQLPTPFNQVYTLPIMSEEFIACLKEYKIADAYFYNTFPTTKLLSDFIMIKAMQQFKTEDEKRASANRLINSFNLQDENEGFIIYVVLEEKGKRLTTWLMSNTNWNYCSGVVAACVAMQMLEICIANKKGCHFAQSIVDIEELFNQLLRTEYISITREK
ncbi:saccharopine dehydrogenase NADP-binding domain-containing protein [Lysinibacillus sp. NPDC056185]|uniref:saccharopine dehydrogenase NADP-binding domain-containing protein n=1 Tax=Lysinibacillus sp. NPDC056185 TaxID=3345739 RepID=UPI0039EE4AF9